jgi:glycosyltransferase involved in cell wall biosynthesis
VRRLLLVTHRSLEQAGGATARWRSLRRHLPAHGWEVVELSAPAGIGAVELATDARDRRLAATRAAVMSRVGVAVGPAFRAAGMRPEAFPPSTAWAARGGRAVRRMLASGAFDAVVATGPPMAGPFAARAGLGRGAPPFVVELRDLWAGSPAFDAGGSTLTRAERALLRPAARVVACTPEAAADLRARHPEVAGRVVEVPNGFEPELLERRPPSREPATPLTILHSGLLSLDRPLAPLLDVLDDRFRLVLHGHVAPEIRAQIAGRPVEIVAPSTWEDAMDRIAAADIALVTQARGAGDATAIASKVYEYLALGRPVLATTDGGATEALLRRLGADAGVARLDDPASIRAALDRLASDPPAPLPPDALEPYRRDHIAAAYAALLDALTRL